MKNSKKAIMFQPLMVVATIAILIYALYLLDQQKIKTAGGKDIAIGTKQYDIMNAYQTGEKALFYIDQSARLSAEQALYQLGEKGGFYRNSDCGAYSDYLIWQTADKECYPDFKANLKLLINDEFKKYLSLYKEVDLKKVDYDYNFYNDKLIGAALEDINVPITDKDNDVFGTYYAKPSFTVKTDYNFESFDLLINNVKEMNLVCSGKAESEKEKCINDFIKTKNLKWKAEKKADNFFVLNITTDKKILVFENSQIKQADFTIKFGYYLKTGGSMPVAVTSAATTPTTSQVPNINFEFSPDTSVPGDSDMKGNVYLKDVYDVARELDVNYNVVLGVLGTESTFGIKLNLQGDGLAHGAMQMFEPATTNIKDLLLAKYPYLPNDAHILYDETFTKKERGYTNIQIYAGTLYLKWTKDCLKNSNKPYDTEIIIRAYHDGCGHIDQNGVSDLNTKEAVAYVPSVLSLGELA